MDRHRPVLDWCRSKQVAAGPNRSVPVGSGAGWCRCRCRGETARNVFGVFLAKRKPLFKTNMHDPHKYLFRPKCHLSTLVGNFGPHEKLNLQKKKFIYSDLFQKKSFGNILLHHPNIIYSTLNSEKFKQKIVFSIFKNDFSPKIDKNSWAFLILKLELVGDTLAGKDISFV